MGPYRERAKFAVRGPSHAGVYIDGVLVDPPSDSLEDNGDVVRSVSLRSGAFPSSYGNRDGINARFIADP